MEFTKNIYYFIYHNLKSYFVNDKIKIENEKNFNFDAINDNFKKLKKIILQINEMNDFSNNKNINLKEKEKIIDKDLEKSEELKKKIINENENLEKFEELKNISKEEQIEIKANGGLNLVIKFISDEKAFDLSNFKLYDIVNIDEINSISEKINNISDKYINEKKQENDFKSNLMFFESHFTLKVIDEKRFNFTNYEMSPEIEKEFLKKKRLMFQERSKLFNEFYLEMNSKKLIMYKLFEIENNLIDHFKKEVDLIKYY